MLVVTIIIVVIVATVLALICCGECWGDCCVEYHPDDQDTNEKNTDSPIHHEI